MCVCSLLALCVGNPVCVGMILCVYVSDIVCAWFSMLCVKMIVNFCMFCCVFIYH